MNVLFMHYKILLVEMTIGRGVEAERNTPSGGDCHCTHWPLVVNLKGCRVIALGLGRNLKQTNKLKLWSRMK